MSRALATAYAASAARVGSWLIVFGLVYRASGDAGQKNLGLLALARATAGLLGYASLGITPVLVRLLSKEADDAEASRRTYATAVVLVRRATMLFGLVLVAGVLIGAHFSWTALGSSEAVILFLAIGMATLFRSISEVFASVLLASGQITSDNIRQLVGEIVFVVAALIFLKCDSAPVQSAGLGYLLSSIYLICARGLLASRYRKVEWAAFDRNLVWPILLLCGGVLGGQLADWLYAPLNQILIGHHLGQAAVGPYAVTLQIDGGLLLLVGGLATVMLPSAAIAFQQNRLADLRQNFVQAWMGSLLLLAGASGMVVMLSAIIFEHWFGNPMPTAQAILPLVLIHTTIGGTAGISRAVLLGIGRVKAYTLSAILGGIANAFLAYVLLTHTTLGLSGVIWATIITVFIRCGLWMPWFTLRCLRSDRLPPTAASSI